MDELIQTTPHYFRIAPGIELPDVTQFAPFKAVVILEADYSDEWQNEVSDWLVANGCLYMMAWGRDCSNFHDRVDWSNLEEHDFKVPDDKFVMTTWHENESLESVFWYSQFCANFSYDEGATLTDAVLLHVSEVDRESQYLQLFEESKTLAERDPE
jgi:hypothetical protein